MNDSIKKAVLAGLALVAAASLAGAVQSQITIQGYAYNGSGTPYTTPQTAEFKVYQGGNATTAGSGALYFDETATISPSASGVFDYALGSGSPTAAYLVVGGNSVANVLSTTTFDTASAVYLEISVAGNIVLPRIQFHGAPYASLATVAEHLKPTDVLTATTLTVSSGTFTASGPNQASITTSSGIVAGGPVTAPAFVGTFYGNVVGSAQGAPPIGSLLAYAGTGEPIGWVECNGRSLLQNGTATASWGSYSTSSLFAALGTIWGSAGAGVFNIPDLRGIFPRGWNHGKTGNYADPDATARGAQYPSGVTSDAIGSYQTDQLRSHTHTYIEGVWPGGVTASGFSGSSGTMGSQPSGATGGNETRPMNASVMYLIRVQ
jgi:microcystin-dependent protein